MLVERDREVAVLSRLARAAATGTPGLVLVEGPVGIGKSALLDRLAAEARDTGTQVLKAQCTTQELDLPFGVMRRLFGGPLSEPGRPAQGDTPPDWQRFGLDPDALPDGANTVAQVPHGTLLALYHVLCRMAMDHPLTVIVDDAHHADPASLRLLSYLGRRLHGLPVLLAISRCTDTGTHIPQLDEIAAQPQCHSLRPRLLSNAGVTQLLRHITGSGDDKEIPPVYLTVASGNPLLSSTLFTALRPDNWPSATAGPSDIDSRHVALLREQVLRVLRRQAATTCAAVQAMAVLGEGAPPQTYARLAGLDTPVFVQAVLTLASAGLVSATPSGRNWSFAHGLVRDAVLADIPPEQRAERHRHSARLLLDNGASAKCVAEHLRMAPAPVTDSWLVAVLREAAREALLYNDPRRAIDLLKLCVSEDTDPASDAEILFELGMAEAAVDVHASVRHLRLAADHLKNPQLELTALTTVADGMFRVPRSMQTLCPQTAHRLSAADDSNEPAMLREALRLLDLTKDARSLLSAADECRYLDLPGETPGERAVLAMQAVISVAWARRIPEARAAARRVITDGMAAYDSFTFLLTAATALLFADRPDEAERVFAHVGDTAPHPDGPLPPLVGIRAETSRRLGALEEALATTEIVLARVPEEKAHQSTALPAAVRVHTLLDQGDVAGAAAMVSRGFLRMPGGRTWQWDAYLCARGRLRLDQGDPEGALRNLRECGKDMRGWGSNPALSSWWFWAGKAHLALGDTERARAHAEEAVADARAAELPRALGMGLELLAAAHGDRGAELSLLEEAETALETSAAPLELTRVRVAYGSALHRAGHTKDARSMLRRALEAAYELGARGLYQEAHQALLATGARPRRPMLSGLGSLTPSEMQVAQQAAAGLSNLEISALLFVTQRTVELHLTSVYRKLGLSGRRQLHTALDGAPSERVARQRGRGSSVGPAGARPAPRPRR
ncbi:AAA family ATPase [Streptomyces sp. NBC_01231]|nr:AAA family ATPase [Streptomyces sp. NBC_01231]